MSFVGEDSIVTFMPIRNYKSFIPYGAMLSSINYAFLLLLP